MTHVAIVDEDKVTNVIVGDIDAVRLILPHANIIEQTAETGVPHVGGMFIDGKFRAPQPYPSWSWDDDTQSWVAPIPYPQDNNAYVWDETIGDWQLVPMDTEAGEDAISNDSGSN